ncbi:MAG: hypothetical protein CL402_08725 [Acidiferrobacteraceae bacterium]|nr:hypothetical protein [Acidiferrobacteraceae bacterium]|tara:strand:+ start:21272 stop:22321 length:1050 start_codon:yes stop_codon:yes gene_type:complete
MTTLPPWLQKIFNESYTDKTKFPTALLINGAQGVGKFELANAFARKLLCQAAKEDQDCVVCSSCHLFMAGTHPDYHLITNEHSMLDNSHNFIQAASRYQLSTEKERSKRKIAKRIISVEQIRDLIGNLSVSAHYGAAKVVIIHPAEELNINASNALLKTLEEPTLNTYFFILIKEAYLLPATIRSRCVKLSIPLPNEEISLDWLCQKLGIERADAQTLLQLSGNSPFHAHDIHNNEGSMMLKTLPHDLHLIVRNQIPLAELIKKWSDNDTRLILRWLQIEIINAFRASVGIKSSETGTLLYRNIGLITCLRIYRKVGLFLTWPVNATDEKLFLESTIVDLSNNEFGETP